MTNVLRASPLPPALERALVERHAAVDVPAPGDSARPSALAALDARIRVAVTTARYGLGADDLEALPDLEAVVSFGAGTDALDLDLLGRRGIVVSTTPDVLTDAVADLAVGLLIDVARDVTRGDRYVRAGRWGAGRPLPLASQVTGRRVGILGLGRIGRAVAERLTGFRCEIGYHNRRRLDDVAHRYLSSAAELAEWADVLMVTAPGGGGVLVDAEVLHRLGPDGILVNVGRGSVVDESELVSVLREGRIAGAGLDVFADEPRVPSALLEMPRVVLTPHIGSATEETRQQMADLVLENVQTFLEHGRLVSPLTP